MRRASRYDRAERWILQKKRIDVTRDAFLFYKNVLRMYFDRMAGKTHLEFNVVELTKWLDRAGDHAREKLAVESKVSRPFIDKLVATRRLPKGEALYWLSRALKVPMESLVVVKPDKKSA
jgi:hypothetical protein